MATDGGDRMGLQGNRGFQVGDGNVQHNYFGPVTQVHYTAAGPAVLPIGRAYLEQVRRIAPADPPGLIGREGELEELARFCLTPEAGPYLWWQGEAWAGKSALLSAFVLRPPAHAADRVRIVSFFVTARLAGQDTRDAYVQVLAGQLAGLLGEHLPPVMPEATREAFMLGLLSRAAAGCAREGTRLVLVVDGLDEDRGVTAGGNGHSIAGLLPASPPHGMRVIVGSRPSPPVPGDVPDRHPLRDQRIIRRLSPSPHAGDLRRLGNLEVKRLLGGPDAARDVLALLAAARGGLSARDLEELTGVPLWDIEEILDGAAGRTFSRRPARSGDATYLLGHEELQAAAVGYLGDSRLAGYRERLNCWADSWRDRGWPAGTPEYLLGGYYRLLDDAGDLGRMTAHAADPARHDRMLDLTGGDAAAAAEVRTALDRVAAQAAPDLDAALALACHRDRLASRSAAVPAALPAAWAALGQPLRAEALADSVPYPGGRARMHCRRSRARSQRQGSTSRQPQSPGRLRQPRGQSPTTLSASRARWRAPPAHWPQSASMRRPSQSPGRLKRSATPSTPRRICGPRSRSGFTRNGLGSPGSRQGSS